MEHSTRKLEYIQKNQMSNEHFEAKNILKISKIKNSLDE